MIRNKVEILALVKQDGMNLRLAFWDLREDKEVVMEALKNNPYSLQFADEKLQKDEELLSYVTKDDNYYWSMIDDNGSRYSIPMLNSAEPNYYYKYVYYMKLKESSPSTFDSILRWD